jgi:hypothetical protein
MPTPIQTKTPMTLTGTIDTIEILDSGAAPNTVITNTDPFKIHATWSVAGSAVPFLGGEWTVRALVESIGAGFEGQIGLTQTVPLTGQLTPYDAVIDVPAHTLPAPAVNEDTVYKLVVLVSHKMFGVSTPIAGFGEGTYFEIQI